VVSPENTRALIRELEPSRTTSRVDGRRWLGLGLLCLAFFLDVMASTSVFTASPQIQRALNLSQTGLQWSFTAATLPGGALLLVGARTADVFGRRRTFMIALAGVGLSSLACGLARSAPTLIAARVVFGAVSAFLMPAALALLIETFVEETERGRALAAWSAIGGIGATAGLVLGGLVTDGLGWRWVFLINVPTAALMLALGPLLLSEPAERHAAPRVAFRWIAGFSIGLALGVYGVSEIPLYGWHSWRTLGLALSGLVVLAAFALVQRGREHQLLPDALRRSRAFRRGNLTVLVAGMCVDGLLFTLTLYTQKVWGYTPLEFGAVTAVMTVGSSAAAVVAQRAVATLGGRLVSLIGLGLLIVTCLDFAVATVSGAPHWLLLIGMVVFGCGMGCAFVAGSVDSVQDAGEREAGIAAAIQTIAFSTGATLGVAALSSIAGSRSNSLVATVGAAAANASGARFAFVAGAVIAAVGLLVVLGQGDSEPGPGEMEPDATA
jgi:MFS family permease